jgi:hypothetical protein
MQHAIFGGYERNRSGYFAVSDKRQKSLGNNGKPILCRRSVGRRRSWEQEKSEE